ncbi:procathepsin L-like [Rhincodon typus]|uniref:procathepsin L-like n=1 Tax=Rhincodon typus TaxID=259920 RepID=UPI002030D10F|nr:procathepsin L-like [Rhincodon typus]XP_048470162.1 procathepsin L-like [Rhincodon typus]XP_048470163.1 procathepsin L-like [Rhincodon typus]XP_048470164.1 procathepsin L-like [Rhincodon typus]XP_048470165.1 procathepsin L-like [Rhincodon typus]
MMKTFLVLMTWMLTEVSSFTCDPALDESWMKWTLLHGKQYEKNEENWRRITWEKNLQKIKQHNLEHAMGKHTFRMEMNHFGDMTNEEFNQVMNGFIQRNLQSPTPNEESLHYHDKMDIPQTIDWRGHGYVTEVKNQGHCGSCWAFSATGSLEGQIYRKTNKLISLSEQNLVDCSRHHGNNGCSGGLIQQAFKYVQRNGGIDNETYYPYIATDMQSCQYNPLHSVANCTGYKTIRQGSEAALAMAVASVGPISVAVDAAQLSFQFYQSGIYHDNKCSATNLNHAVLVVGYGTHGQGKTAQNYWIIKNSWGKHWGINGYMLLAKDTNNQCGIAKYAVYPLV